MAGVRSIPACKGTMWRIILDVNSGPEWTGERRGKYCGSARGSIGFLCNFDINGCTKGGHRHERSFLHFNVDLKPSFATIEPSISSKSAKFTAFIISIFIVLVSLKGSRFSTS